MSRRRTAPVTPVKFPLKGKGDLCDILKGALNPMKTSKKAVSAILASILLIGTASCGGGGRPASTTAAAGGGDTAATTEAAPAVTDDPNKEFDIEKNYDELANIEEVDSKNEEGAGKLYESGKKAGVLNALCYYKFENEEPENRILDLYAERFGGTVEVNMCSFGNYSEKLGMLLASGDSPDLIRYEWTMLPGLMLENKFTALDDWLDIDSPIWAEMRDQIDYYQYKGKHFYFPQERKPGYGIVYNTAHIEEIGAERPMDLYFQGNWTWNEFEDIMMKWKANDPSNVGVAVAASSAIHLIATTGTPTVEYTGTDIINNVKSQPVTRAMEFMDKLSRARLIHNAGDIADIDYIGPDNQLAWTSGKLMFFIMGPEWATKCGQQTNFQNNLEGTVEFVPMPRDPEADKYYLMGSTYGYLVPAGAPNLQGAVSWILAGRIYRTDPDVIAKEDEMILYDGPYYYGKCTKCKHAFDSERGEENETCPECGEPRKPKFKITYSPEQLQVAKDVCDSSKFTFVYDDHRGFGTDCMNLFCESADNMFDTPLHGNAVFSEQVEAFYNVAETYFDKYRKAFSE